MSTEALGQYMVVQQWFVGGRHPLQWDILNKRSGISLGTVAWYAKWKRYVFEAEEGCIFDAQCHRDIADFLDRVNAEHKVQKSLRQAAQTEPAVWGAPIPPEEGT